MKCNIWAAIASVLVVLVSMALVLTGSSGPFGKLKYSFAVVLLGVLVYYIGDKC